LQNTVISACKKSLVPDKKTSFYKPFKIEGVYRPSSVGSRHAKPGNPKSCPKRDEEFPDGRNTGPLAREHKLKKTICGQNRVFLPGRTNDRFTSIHKEKTLEFSWSLGKIMGHRARVKD
jgi:hypothetical protein